MPSVLGKYTLLRTLGSGANSKVKLGLDKSSGRYYAVKILKKGNPNLDHKFLELVMTEVHTMSTLNHPNIVNLIEYGKDGVVERSDGSKEPVIYIILELATGGELFDYVAQTGRFSEKICRFYFHQLMDGLEYVHGKGITHRDLKPENVLYDQYFNLKIADFGFAAPIAGRDGSGYNKTKLGTESYMAPEIHMRKPYNGPSVDLFASAIILFIMFTQHPPFTKAEPNDPFYRLLCANRADLFWKAHGKNKPEGFFSEEFKNMITSMLQFDPSHRLSLADVKAHPWYNNGEIATLEEIQKEFAQRKYMIDQENEQKRLEKEAQKAQQKAAGGAVAARRQYRKAVAPHRDYKEGETEESKYDFEEPKREIEEYVKVVNKNTEFFTTQNPTQTLNEIAGYFEECGFKFEVADNKYKVKGTIIQENEEPVEMTIKILQAENGKYAVDFYRNGGDQLKFFQHYASIKDYFGDIVDASY